MSVGVQNVAVRFSLELGFLIRIILTEECVRRKGGNEFTVVCLSVERVFAARANRARPTLPVFVPTLLPVVSTTESSERCKRNPNM